MQTYRQRLYILFSTGCARGDNLNFYLTYCRQQYFYLILVVNNYKLINRIIKLAKCVQLSFFYYSFTKYQPYLDELSALFARGMVFRSLSVSS